MTVVDSHPYKNEIDSRSCKAAAVRPFGGKPVELLNAFILTICLIILICLALPVVLRCDAQRLISELQNAIIKYEEMIEQSDGWQSISAHANLNGARRNLDEARALITRQKDEGLLHVGLQAERASRRAVSGLIQIAWALEQAQGAEVLLTRSFVGLPFNSDTEEVWLNLARKILKGKKLPSRSQRIPF